MRLKDNFKIEKSAPCLEKKDCFEEKKEEKIEREEKIDDGLCLKLLL